MKKLFYTLIVSIVMFSCNDEELEKNPLITKITPEFITQGSEITIEGTDLGDNPTFAMNYPEAEPSRYQNKLN